MSESFKIFPFKNDCNYTDKGRLIDNNINPYIKFDIAGNRRLCHTTVHPIKGYSCQAVWAVQIDEQDVMVFIGEKPHKNEEGKWVTNNDAAISFINNSFPGAHSLSTEEPQLITFMTEKFWENEKERHEKVQKEFSSLKWTMNTYTPTFKEYINGLYKRIKAWFSNNIIHFYYTKGARMHFFTMTFGYFFSKKRNRLAFCFPFNRKDIYSYFETEDWVYWFYIKKDNKWGFYYNKTHNTGDSCSV